MPAHARKLVLIGAGHAHVQVLKQLGDHPIPGLQATLIAPNEETPYSGMIPGFIAGHYSWPDIHIDAAALARFANARFIRGKATRLDLARQTVLCQDHTPVPFDLLSINTGSVPGTTPVPGASDHAIPVKPIDGLLKELDGLKERILAARGQSHIAVVGAGATGVELVLALAHRLRRELQEVGIDERGLNFTLLSGASDILPDFPQSFRRRMERVLRERQIAVLKGAPVRAVERGLLHIEGGSSLAADEIFWATAACAPGWLKETGLPLDQQGFVKVDDTLRVEGHENIFAAGDIISFSSRPLPKSGVYAVRAGAVLAGNLRRAAEGEKLVRFRPQRNALYILTTGERRAVAFRNGLSLEGSWVWRWKDWLDRRFLRQFRNLPEKEAAAEKEAAR